MGLSSRDRQELGCIEERLVSSDPELASMLATFSRLVAGENMPERERIRTGRAARRRRHESREPADPGRPRGRISRSRKAVALWLVMTVALIVAAVTASHIGGAGPCAAWSAACASQSQMLHKVGGAARRAAGPGQAGESAPSCPAAQQAGDACGRAGSPTR